MGGPTPLSASLLPLLGRGLGLVAVVAHRGHVVVHIETTIGEPQDVIDSDQARRVVVRAPDAGGTPLGVDLVPQS